MNLKMTEAQKTLYYIAENMKMEKKISDEGYQHFQMAIKALEQQKPMEKFENAKDHIRKLAGDYKCWDNRLTDEEALELCHILEQQPSDDCVSREQAIKTIGTDIQLNLEGRSGLLKYSDEIKDILKALLDSQEKKLKALPPVTPTHGTCEDCFYYNIDEDGHGYHCEKYGHTRFPVYADFYCKDFTHKE